MTTSSIFISSVQKELADERRALKAFIEGDALLRRYFTAFLFEDLPVADVRADAVYRDRVDRCAVYVDLFGNDYGLEDAKGVSPVAREMARKRLKWLNAATRPDARRHERHHSAGPIASNSTGLKPPSA